MSELEDHSKELELPECPTFWNQVQIAIDTQKWFIAILVINLGLMLMPNTRLPLLKLNMVILFFVAVSSTIFVEIFKQDGRNSQSLLKKACELLQGMSRTIDKLTKENDELKKRSG